jgi:formiminotetrahydrofolate cyclodeaminase
MSLWTLRLDEFRDRTASRAPTPGGGSVAAVCATLGTGLIIMAAEITQASPSPPAELAPALAHARALLATLAAAADADVAAFDGFMAALALPRASDNDKAARKQAMAAAARAASEAPLAAAQAMLDVLALARTVEPLVKASVVSDVLAGADLLRGAVVAMLRNVDINLPHVGDDDTRRALAERRDQLLRALR